MFTSFFFLLSAHLLFAGMGIKYHKNADKKNEKNKHIGAIYKKKVRFLSFGSSEIINKSK